MSLLSLPNELLLRIASDLGSDAKALSHLLLTSRRLSSVSTHLLHCLALEDKDGEPALHWAADRGHCPLLELLLENGADINLRDKLGETALVKAAAAGHINVIHILLDRGADIERPQ